MISANHKCAFVSLFFEFAAASKKLLFMNDRLGASAPTTVAIGVKSTGEITQQLINAVAVTAATAIMSA